MLITVVAISASPDCFKREYKSSDLRPLVRSSRRWQESSTIIVIQVLPLLSCDPRRRYAQQENRRRISPQYLPSFGIFLAVEDLPSLTIGVDLRYSVDSPSMLLDA